MYEKWERIRFAKQKMPANSYGIRSSDMETPYTTVSWGACNSLCGWDVDIFNALL